MAGEGGGNSRPALAVPTASGKHSRRRDGDICSQTPSPLPASFVAAVCHAVLAPGSRGGRRHPLLPMQSIPQTELAKHPPPKKRGARGGSSRGLGTGGDKATSRWQWLLIPRDRARLSRLGQGSAPPAAAPCTHSIAGS